MFKSDLSGQRQIFAFTSRDLVPDDSDVWIYCDLFDTLDLDEFYFDYSSQGEEAIDPKLMLRTIFYGLTHGVSSGRKLAKACEFDNRYIVLSGNQSPDARTFQRFLKRHPKRLADLFIQVVRLAQKVGLVSLGRVAIDGTRLKGYTSRGRTATYETIVRAVKEIERELEMLKANTEKENSAEADVDSKIPDEIKKKKDRLEAFRRAKAQIEKESGEKTPKETIAKSFSDLEATSLGPSKNDGFLVGYNGQIVVDEGSQIVISAEVFPKIREVDMLEPMLNDAITNCGKAPETVLADAGYTSAANIRFVEEKGAEPVFSLKAEYNAKEAHIEGIITTNEQVTPGNERGEYYCLNRKQLPVVSLLKDGKTYVRISDEFCAGCQFQNECRLYGRRNQKRIQLPPEINRLTMVKIFSKSRTESYKQSYKRRKAIVEPVFANIKFNKMLRIFVRGKDNVSTWWKIVTTAHNLEKIVKAFSVESGARLAAFREEFSLATRFAALMAYLWQNSTLPGRGAV
jgi:transposase